MGERDLDVVTGMLRELSRKELVRPARQSSMAGEAEYAFGHILARDVAYNQLPRASRAARHVAAAAWIESKVPGPGRGSGGRARLPLRHCLRARPRRRSRRSGRASSRRRRCASSASRQSARSDWIPQPRSRAPSTPWRSPRPGIPTGPWRSLRFGGAAFHAGRYVDAARGAGGGDRVLRGAR